MPDSRTPERLAARLVDHARSGDQVGIVDASAAAIHGMSAELSSLLGVDGCQALLLRVLMHARATHPALTKVDIVLGSNPHLEFAEGLDGWAPEEIAAGLQTALVNLFDLLGRLIGDDLSVQLADRSMANALPAAAKSDDEKAPQ